MTFFEKCIYEKVKQFSRDLMRPVPTSLIADFVGKDPRTIRYSLVNLEKKGLIERRGQRGGWYPVTKPNSEPPPVPHIVKRHQPHWFTTPKPLPVLRLVTA